MAAKRRRFDQDFKDGAVRIVLETGRPIAEVARERGVQDGTLGNWVAKSRKQHDPGALKDDGRRELFGLRREVKELRLQRDLLKLPVVLWVVETIGRRPPAAASRWARVAPTRGRAGARAETRSREARSEPVCCRSA